MIPKPEIKGRENSSWNHPNLRWQIIWTMPTECQPCMLSIGAISTVAHEMHAFLESDLSFCWWLPSQLKLDHLWLVGASFKSKPSISCVFQHSRLNGNWNNTSTFASYQSQYTFWMWAVTRFRLKQVHTLTICGLKIQKIVQMPPRKSNTHTLFHQYFLTLAVLSMQFTWIMS